MRIEAYEYKNVDSKTGKLADGGAVNTKGGVMLSENEGCGLPDCHCSDGYWLSIIAPIMKGTVKGITVYFDGAEEYAKFKRSHELEL